MSNRATILTELNAILGKTIYWPSNLPYTLPINYFSVQSLEAIKNSIGNTAVLPNNYFNNFPTSILVRIKNELENAGVPDNYFNDFSSNLLNKIKSESINAELESIAPTLNQISNKNVYSVPEGYFNNVISTPKAKIFTIKSLKYAAAILLIVLGTVGYLVLKPQHNNLPTIVSNTINNTIEDNNNKLPTIENNSTELVPNSAVAKVAEQNIEAALNEVNEDELMAFVDTHAVSAVYAEPLNQIEVQKIDGSIDGALNNLSDAEIEQYLNDNIN